MITNSELKQSIRKGNPNLLKLSEPSQLRILTVRLTLTITLLYHQLIFCLATAGKPGTPEPEDWSANHVDLKWTEPISDGGSPITGYIIEMKDKYSPLWEKAVETTSANPKATVTGLVEGNDYQFRVIAVNAAGPSAPSDASKVFTAKPRFCKSFHLIMLILSLI